MIINEYRRRNSYLGSRLHPTKSVLVETLSQMLDNRRAGDILIDKLLESSGVSKGSLYHHFGDFSELIETVYVHCYALWIDASIDFLGKRVIPSRTKEELRAALLDLTKLTQSDRRKRARAELAQALAECIHNERLAKKMGEEDSEIDWCNCGCHYRGQEQGVVSGIDLLSDASHVYSGIYLG